MREYELAYQLKGLNPRRKTNRMEQWLEDCFNFKPSQSGLIPYEAFTRIFDGQEVSWPFPQLLIGKTRNYLVVRFELAETDKIYEVASDLTLTLRFTLPWATYGQGSRFDLVDYGLYALLTNGEVILEFDYTEIELGEFNVYTGMTHVPVFNSFCDIEGQVFGGGVKSSWYECDEKSIAWSNIGDISFNPDSRNVAGFRVIGICGEVLRVMKFGRRAAIFGTEGIAIATPVSQPVVTFGVELISPVGIAGRDAVDGDGNTIYYISSDGNLMMLGKESSILGYSIPLSNLTLSNVVLTLDRHRTDNDLYISDGSRCYLFNQFGMSEVYQNVLGILNSSVRQAITVESDDDDANLEARILTDQFDFGLRGQKTIVEVEAGLDAVGSTNFSAVTRLHGRFDKASDFEQTGWIELNKEGVAYPTIAGTDLKVELRTSDYRYSNIDWLKARYKMTDMRNIRGVYAPPPRGQDADSTNI